MAYIDDVNKFKEYIKQKYGVDIIVKSTKSKNVTKYDPRIIKWAVVVSEYFNCDIDELFAGGRKNNSYEKIWFRYFVVMHEGISLVQLFPLVGLRDHSTLSLSIKRSLNWIEVYREIYDDLVKKGEEYDKERDELYKIDLSINN